AVQTEKEPDQTNQLKVGRLLITLDERRIFWEEEEFEVTTKEYEMLLLFAENPNRACSREELLIQIWGNDYFGSDRAVDDLVKRIRKKLPEVPIETVWGFGYRLRKEED